MTPLQKMLVLVVAAETVVLAGLRLRTPPLPALPAVRKEALDPATIRQIEHLEHSLRPGDATDWARLADVYRAFNLLGAAEYCFRQIDRLAPQSTGHLFDWAATLSRMGDTAQAARIGARVSALGETHAGDVRLMAARDRLREENPAAAEKLLREITNSPEANQLLARLLMRTGRAKEAEAILDQSLAVTPDELRARQLRAWAAAAGGDTEEARKHRIMALRCRNWSHQDDPASAREQRLRQQFGRDAMLAGVAALEAQSKWDEAAALIRQALAVSWSDQDARRLAEIELNAGRPQRAIAELERLIATTGATGENLLALSRAWSAQGDTARALALLNRAQILGGNNSPMGNLQIQQALGSLATARNDAGAARLHQGRAQFELGKMSWLDNNVPAARQQFLRATALAPELVHAWYYLGETSALLGYSTAARQSLERCLQLQPNHGRALDSLARLR